MYSIRGERKSVDKKVGTPKKERRVKQIQVLLADRYIASVWWRELGAFDEKDEGRANLGAGETRSVDDQTEKASCERTDDGNGDDPSVYQNKSRSVC